MLNFQLAAFGRGAGRQGFKSKLQRFGHNAAQRADAQPNHMDPACPVLAGLFQCHVQCAFHDGQFVHAAEKATEAGLPRAGRS